MASRLSQRSATALVIYFALITSVCAPLAYFAGKDRGAFDAGAAMLDPSLFDTPADYESLVTALRSGAGCGKGEPGVERYGAWEVYCGPGSGTGDSDASGAQHLAAAERPGGAGRARSGNDGPLQKAVLLALAGSETAGTDAGPGNPFSLALAPDGNPAGGLGPGTVLPPGGFPGVLVPGGGYSPTPPSGPPSGPPAGPPSGPPSQPPFTPPFEPPPGPPSGPPGTEPPPLVTPLPPALPLMIAGLGGLYAASRRRKT